MTLVITSTAEIAQKSGANVSTNYTSTMQDNAEIRGLGLIQMLTRYMWADNIPSNADIKSILADFLSSFVAIEAIFYDMSGYTSRAEAEDMIEGLRDSMMRSAALLRDKKVQTLMLENV